MLFDDAMWFICLGCPNIRSPNRAAIHLYNNSYVNNTIVLCPGKNFSCFSSSVVAQGCGIRDMERYAKPAKPVEPGPTPV